MGNQKFKKVRIYKTWNSTACQRKMCWTFSGNYDFLYLNCMPFPVKIGFKFDPWPFFRYDQV